MGLGPATRAFAESADVQAPGACVFVGGNPKQISNTEYACPIHLPKNDADGSGLTGLKMLHAGVALGVEPGIDPTEGLSSAELLVMPGANVQSIPLTDADADTDKAVKWPVLSLGPVHYFFVIPAD